jgi:hypothetical protein
MQEVWKYEYMLQENSRHDDRQIYGQSMCLYVCNYMLVYMDCYRDFCTQFMIVHVYVYESTNMGRHVKVFH